MGRKRYRRKKSGDGWGDAEQCQLADFLALYRDSALSGGAILRDSYLSRIGGVEMPNLSEKGIVSAPYLQFSSNLTSKQRKMVHETSVQLKLYHASVGEDRESRFVVVSVFSDGFDSIGEGLQKPSQRPVHEYKPWFCRDLDDNMPIQPLASPGAVTSRKQLQLERIARAEINKLIDQPGNALRDSIDILDFQEWNQVDLSDIPGRFEDDTKFMFVDTAEKMRECVDELLENPPNELAFDLELLNQNKYTQLTCLLQLATDSGHEYVIDTLVPGVFEMVGELGPIFMDPTVVKIGHAIGGLDVRSLHRDFGLFVVNAFDTLEASKILGLKANGLAAVCKHYGFLGSDEYLTLKSKYQNCDWTQRPLTLPMIQYGRYDVRFLIRLRMLLIRDLTRTYLFDKPMSEQDEEARAVAFAFQSFNERESHEAATSEPNLPAPANLEDASQNEYRSVHSSGSIETEFFSVTESEEDVLGTIGDRSQVSSLATAAALRLQPSLMGVLSISQLRCIDLWSSRIEPCEKNGFLLTLARRSRSGTISPPFSEVSYELYLVLARWRDSVALRLECLPGFVASLDFLVQIAWQRPLSEEALRRVTYFLPPVLAERPEFVEELLNLINNSFVENKEQIPEDTYVFHKEFTERKVSDDNEGGMGWKMACLAVMAVGVAAAAILTMSRGSRRKR